MKSLTNVIYLFSMLFFTFLTSCNSVEQNTDECNSTKWSEPKEPTVTYYIAFPADIHCNTPSDSIHVINKATTLNFTGSVTKVYCSGENGSTFTYNSIYYVGSELDIFSKLGQAYQFKFENDKDYLSFKFKITANFSDGQVYISREMTTKLSYKNLLLDTTTGGYQYNDALGYNTIIWFRQN